ncbi:hypothetical protein DPMN_055395 [Dreissena polymorpha]|uniref:Uncharacterized protein n=1 Tax=Dreissena polymorpha TaxID=45954 RepID=A0A9D4CPX3_DREPO|nr:hypothetical protein DPMN_055395 [Dreissena polymorpha]
MTMVEMLITVMVGGAADVYAAYISGGDTDEMVSADDVWPEAVNVFENDARVS